MGENGGSGGKRRKRDNFSSPPLDLSFDGTKFPLLLAAASNAQKSHSRSLAKRLLRSLLSLLSTTPSSLFPPSFLSLFPLLLRSSYPSLAALSLEVVGAAALCSLETNAMVASDEVVVKGLVWALESRSRRVLNAACNAILDLSTSQIGRERLRDSFTVEKLLSLLCQVETFSVGSLSFRSMGKESIDGLISGSNEDNFVALVIDAAVILINTSTKNFLDRIPDELLKIFLPLLKGLWYKVRSSKIPSHDGWEKNLRSTEYDLTAVIFRLSMNQTLFRTREPNEIRISIFGSTESEFENFVRDYWENSPHVLRGQLINLENTTIFDSFISSFNPKDTDIISSVLQGLVSCPPISSDELDICSFLNEVKGELGSPIIYGQDIRVLKTPKSASDTTQRDVNKEMHFFNDNMVSQFADTWSVQKCKEAFQDGYTIALRGMEFRSDAVAAIADGLAVLFGKPSVGANIYLTPPGSQGLARHYDDHCVFVWQLYGQKQWRVSPRPTNFLPRLYEPLGALHDLEGDLCGDIQYLLKEGDVLYIPRGCCHEAHTRIDESGSENEASTGFSLHITLGIEVEPPFEWEGFAHIALHCWSEKHKDVSSGFTDFKMRRQRDMFVNLLHVAIKLIADDNPTFRKACMVAACPMSSNTLMLNQKATFKYIIQRIDAGSSFMEAFKNIETVVHYKNDNSVQWMKWLQHLPPEGAEKKMVDFSNLFGVFDDFVMSYGNHIDEAATEFSLIKSRFCREVVFDDACKCFKILLEKYRRTRRQYMKGMLSLHSNMG